jgi:hypothetical protein
MSEEDMQIALENSFQEIRKWMSTAKVGSVFDFHPIGILAVGEEIQPDIIKECRK